MFFMSIFIVKNEPNIILSYRKDQSRWKKWTVPITNEGIKPSKCPFFHFHQQENQRDRRNIIILIYLLFSWLRLHEIWKTFVGVQFRISLLDLRNFILAVRSIFRASLLNPFKIGTFIVIPIVILV